MSDTFLNLPQSVGIDFNRPLKIRWYDDVNIVNHYSDTVSKNIEMSWNFAVSKYWKYHFKKSTD